MFSKVFIPYFIFPPVGHKSSCVSTSSSTFDLVSSFSFSHYNSLMTNNIEHLCLYLLTIPMSFFLFW